MLHKNHPTHTLVEICLALYIFETLDSEIFIFFFLRLADTCEYISETQEEGISLYLGIKIHGLKLRFNFLHFHLILSESRLEKFLHIHRIEMESDKFGIFVGIFRFASGYETGYSRILELLLDKLFVRIVRYLINSINTNDGAILFGLFEDILYFFPRIIFLRKIFPLEKYNFFVHISDEFLDYFRHNETLSVSNMSREDEFPASFSFLSGQIDIEELIEGDISFMVFFFLSILRSRWLILLLLIFFHEIYLSLENRSGLISVEDMLEGVVLDGLGFLESIEFILCSISRICRDP